MEALSTSETSVYSSETTPHYIPEDSHDQDTEALVRNISPTFLTLFNSTVTVALFNDSKLCILVSMATLSTVVNVVNASDYGTQCMTCSFHDDTV